MNKGEEQELERIEIWALKDSFDLPLHIATVAVIYTFGMMYVKYEIQIRQLRNLHKLLTTNAAN